ncbi:MAG TPA: GNAT family N-acetyltransferase [Sphingomonas sp.]
MTGPTISTPRLTLTPHAASDFDEVAALYGDEGVMARIGVPPSTREESWHRLLRYVGHWSTMGFGHWVVRETTTGRYLGDVGLMESRRATLPSFEGTPEAAWAFATAAQGRGFAREAAAAMLAWADGQGIARTVAIIGPANDASVRLAGRLGYADVGEVAYKGGPLRFFERPRPG